MFGKVSISDPLSRASQLEAILYFKAQDVTVKELASVTDSSIQEVKSALKELQESLKDRGVSLVLQGNRAVLTSDARASKLIESMTNGEKEKELSKSALETLSIVSYKGPVSRPEIDYIRGVNSTYALRNLVLRGLIEKVKDGGATLYMPSIEALRFMGAESQEDLPHFEKLNTKADAVIKEEHTREEQESSTIFDESSDNPETQNE